jgi:hypothetical protein
MKDTNLKLTWIHILGVQLNKREDTGQSGDVREKARRQRSPGDILSWWRKERLKDTSAESNQMGPD